MRAPALVLAAAVLIPACGGDGSGGFDGAASATMPVAVAGEDQEVLINAAPVTLSAAGSADPTGATPAYLWEQLAGPAVVLASPQAVLSTFTAPGAPATLRFRLTVTGAQGAAADEVEVVVKSFRVTANDLWFSGFGKIDVDLPTALAGSPAGPVTYAWSGGAPWMELSGTTSSTLRIEATPALPDLQNVSSAPAGVIMLTQSAFGRAQFTVTATDTSSGATDDEVVNFSVGPFTGTTANENAALGNPVFLNGGTAASWTWGGAKPNGQPVAFFKPDRTVLGGAVDQRYVYFIPDLPGLYDVTVTHPGPVVKTFAINAGTYVGAGTDVGRAPDPFVGECAACHAGQYPFIADVTGSWKETPHATAFTRLLESGHPLFASVQATRDWRDLVAFASEQAIDARTTGFSRLASSDLGFSAQAELERFAHGGLSGADFKRKHPRTSALANVQCEACHGPGSEHAGDTAGIRKSFDATLCGRCHTGTEELWEASGHGVPLASSSAFSATGSASCNGCHTAQGFVVEARAQKDSDVHTALFAFANLSRPVLPADDRRGVTCQACHDPHAKTPRRAAAGTDPQLRVYGSVTFRNGATGVAGPAASCFLCHNSRTDSRDGSADMGGRRAPHDSTAAEVMSNTGGAEFAGTAYVASAHADPARFVSPLFGAGRSCLACHADVQPAPGAPGYGTLGGHSFRMEQGDGVSLLAGDAANGSGAASAGSRSFSVGSGPVFLRRIFPGDELAVSAGVNAGRTYVVQSVDSGRRLTLGPGPVVSDGADTGWQIRSVAKHNLASCTQCHVTAPAFAVIMRDFDGQGGAQAVQVEVSGLLAAVKGAVEDALEALTGDAAATFAASSGRIRVQANGSNKIFPGPAVAASDAYAPWSSLTPQQQADWTTAYKAAYNHFFVTNDRSGGIHNTGYAVTLLQASYRALTGSTLGSPY